MKKVPKNSEGRFVRVHFDDVGARDGIITYVSDDRLSFRFLELGDNETQCAQHDQLIKVGNSVCASNSGL